MKRIDVHRKLVEAYRKKCPTGWADGPDDGYFFQHLPQHLFHSGRHEELRTLFLNANWLQAKLRVAGVASIFADFQLLAPDPDVTIVARSLQLSLHAISKEPSSFTSQLQSRIGATDPRLAALVEHASGASTAKGFRPIRTSLFESKSPILTSWEMPGEERDVLAINPAGTIAAAAHERTILVWSAQDGNVIKRLEGHNATVTALAFLPHRELIASGSSDRTVRVWEYATGRCLITLKHPDEVTLLVVDALSKNLYAITRGGKLLVWALPAGELAWQRNLSKSHIQCLALSDTRGKLIMGTKDGILLIWDLATRREAFRTKLEWEVIAAAIAPSGTTCAICISEVGEGSRIQIWDVVHPHCISRFGDRECAIKKLAYTPDGSSLIAASYPTPVSDVALMRWQRAPIPIEVYRVGPLSALSLTTRLRAHEGGIRQLMMARDAPIGLSCGADGMMRVWNLEGTLKGDTGTVPAQEGDAPSIRDPKSGKRIAALALNQNADVAVSVMECGRLQIWNARTGALLKTVQRWEVDYGMEPPPSLCMVPGADTLLVTYTANASTGLGELNWKTGEIVREFHVPPIPYDYGDDSALISALALTSTGTIVASCMLDELLLLDYATGDYVGLVRGGNESLMAPNQVPARNPIALSPRGDFLVWGNCEKKLQVLDTLSWATRSQSESYCEVSTIHVLANSAHVLASAYSRGLFIWDIETGKVVHQFNGHSGNVEWAAITANREFAFSCSDDMTLQVWHLQTRRNLGLFRTDNMLTNCATSADGRIVAAGTAAGEVEFFSWIYNCDDTS